MGTQRDCESGRPGAAAAAGASAGRRPSRPEPDRPAASADPAVEAGSGHAPRPRERTELAQRSPRLPRLPRGRLQVSRARHPTTMRPPTPLAAAAATATLAAAVATLLLLARRRRRRASSLEALLRAGKKAVCVGKNYRDHVAELARLGPEWSTDIEPEPILFLKPTTAYAWPGAPLVLPARRRGAAGVASVHGVHHELELGVIVGRACKGLTDEAEAMRCVAGFVLGLDITERDEQTAAKTNGMPWSVCKGHDSFLPLSAPFTLAPGEDWRALRLWLSVNGEQRQACEAGAMIHSVPQLLCFISSVMTLEPPSRGQRLPGRGRGRERGGATRAAPGLAAARVASPPPPPEGLLGGDPPGALAAAWGAGGGAAAARCRGAWPRSPMAPAFSLRPGPETLCSPAPPAASAGCCRATRSPRASAGTSRWPSRLSRADVAHATAAAPRSSLVPWSMWYVRGRGCRGALDDCHSHTLAELVCLSVCEVTQCGCAACVCRVHAARGRGCLFFAFLNFKLLPYHHPVPSSLRGFRGRAR